MQEELAASKIDSEKVGDAASSELVSIQARVEELQKQLEEVQMATHGADANAASLRALVGIGAEELKRAQALLEAANAQLQQHVDATSLAHGESEQQMQALRKQYADAQSRCDELVAQSSHLSQQLKTSEHLRSELQLDHINQCCEMQRQQEELLVHTTTHPKVDKHAFEYMFASSSHVCSWGG